MMKLSFKVSMFALSASVALVVALGAVAQTASASSTTVCASVSEHAQIPTATITCPHGLVISNIDFASYGTPGGTCGSFTVDPACDAANTLAVVESQCLGQHSCSVDASNLVFGDPCIGTSKLLSIQATCGGTCGDGRVNTNCSAPEIMYCNGDNADFYAYNYDTLEGDFDFSIPLADLQQSVSEKTLIKEVGLVKVYLLPDGRVLLVARQTDGKDYFMYVDPSSCAALQEGAEWHVQ